MSRKELKKNQPKHQAQKYIICPLLPTIFKRTDLPVLRMPRGLSSPFRFQRSDHRPEPRIPLPKGPHLNMQPLPASLGPGFDWCIINNSVPQLGKLRTRGHSHTGCYRCLPAYACGLCQRKSGVSTTPRASQR